jgi:hypothetical protein
MTLQRTKALASLHNTWSGVKVPRKEASLTASSATPFPDGRFVTGYPIKYNTLPCLMDAERLLQNLKNDQIIQHVLMKTARHLGVCAQEVTSSIMLQNKRTRSVDVNFSSIGTVKLVEMV